MIHFLKYRFILAPSRGTKYCYQHVCMSVSLLIYLTTTFQTSRNFVYMLIVAMTWSSSDKVQILCNYGFVDYVTFSHNGPFIGNKDVG